MGKVADTGFSVRGHHSSAMRHPYHKKIQWRFFKMKSWQKDLNVELILISESMSSEIRITSN